MDLSLKLGAAFFGAAGIIFFALGMVGKENPLGYFVACFACAAIVFAMFVVGPRRAKQSRH